MLFTSQGEIHINTTEIINRPVDTVFVELISKGNVTYYLPFNVNIVEIPPVVIPNMPPFMTLPPSASGATKTYDPEVDEALHIEVPMGEFGDDRQLVEMQIVSDTLGLLTFSFSGTAPNPNITDSVYMSYENSKKMFSIDIAGTEEEILPFIGKHDIKVVLTDNETATTEYRFTVTILNKEVLAAVVIEIEEQVVIEEKVEEVEVP